jgi:FAD binding domain
VLPSDQLFVNSHQILELSFLSVPLVTSHIFYIELPRSSGSNPDLEKEMTQRTEHPRRPILIVGGGPVGSLLALSLSHFHQSSILVEASVTTTRWPKMEQVNGRTMEVLRMLGLADKLRSTDEVPKADAPWTVLHHTGLGDSVPEFARVVSFYYG